MGKRIVAWILLAGFVFLLLNIMVLHFYLLLSVVLYLIVMFGFLLSSRSRAGFWKANNGSSFSHGSDAGDMGQDAAGDMEGIGSHDEAEGEPQDKN